MSDRHTCVAKSFGKKEMHFCDCDGDGVRECHAKYEYYKKKNYTDSKGQKTFNEKKNAT